VRELASITLVFINSSGAKAEETSVLRKTYFFKFKRGRRVLRTGEANEHSVAMWYVKKL